MGRFGIPEDQPIENSFIGRTLESAQTKIEGFHFDSRKNTLEYDDVMNHQRKVIYERRQKMLFSKQEEIEEILNSIASTREGFEAVIKEKREKVGDQGFFETVRRIALYTTDALWMEHLEAMDYLRSSVNLRAYGQREPIVEYKKDGLMMFKEMEESFKDQVMSLISNINTESITVTAENNTPKQTLVTSHNESAEFSDSPKINISGSNNLNLGRNDPCPCGAINPATGEIYKFKKCGLINAPQHRKSLVN